MDYSLERFLMEIGILFIYRLLGEIEDVFYVLLVLRVFWIGFKKFIRLDYRVGKLWRGKY